MLHEETIAAARKTGTLRSFDRVGAVVVDSASGKALVCIEPDTPMQTASMIKVDIALAYATRNAPQPETFAELLRRIANNEWNAEPLTFTPAFQGAAVDSLQKMLHASSNTATNYFLRELGGPRTTDSILKTNYPDVFRATVVAESIPVQRRPKNIYGRTYGNLASQADNVRVVQLLASGSVPGSQDILGAMRNSSYSRVTRHARLPSTALLARESKTGTTGRVLGEMGRLQVKDANGNVRTLFFSYAIDRTDEFNPATSFGKYTSVQTTQRARLIGELIASTYHTLGEATPQLALPTPAQVLIDARK
jgi:beta-lactamase class A